MNGRYLEVDFNYLFHPNNSEESKEAAITFFDQATVDAEKLHYIQVILNQTQDRVVLDATNGIVWFRNIVVSISDGGKDGGVLWRGALNGRFACPFVAELRNYTGTIVRCWK